jgi:DNA repair photolyase
MSGLEIREVRCKTVLHRLYFGDGSEYTANFYKGCSHGCTYCYVPSLLHDERRWGGYVDVKVNAPHVMDGELKGLEKTVVFLSSASDPYQPLEAKYQVTRDSLKVLHRRGFPVSILTRSPLALRDIDIMKEFGWIRVGVSISTASERLYEPGVPCLERRLAMLRTLGEAGIKTWVSLAPILPNLVVFDFKVLFRRLREAGVAAVLPGLLRFDGYETSRSLFDEVAGPSAAKVDKEAGRLIASIRALAERAGLDTTGSALQWTGSRESSSLDRYHIAG